jgi:tubulin-specific chaperone E
VRPTRPVDQARTFLEALHQKYASEFEEEIAKRKASKGDDFRMNEIIQFNGKVVEEIGFEKIRKQLAELQELKVVLLDGLRMAGVLRDGGGDDTPEYHDELQKIGRTCPKITELDLGRNLLYFWQDVKDICKQLTKLKSLKLK